MANIIYNNLTMETIMPLNAINCHIIYINGVEFAITRTFDEAFLILEALNQHEGLMIVTQTIKSAYIPNIFVCDTSDTI